MSGKLELIEDWESRARRAGYDLSQLALACGVTERRLQQFFRQTLGYSPYKWLRCLRLIDGILSVPENCQIKEAADLLCYPRVATFCESFKAAFGLPPGRFLRQCRTQEDRICFMRNFISRFHMTISQNRMSYLLTSSSNSGIQSTHTMTLTYEHPAQLPASKGREHGLGPADKAPDHRSQLP